MIFSKNKIFLLLILTTFVLSSCNNDDNEGQNNTEIFQPTKVLPSKYTIELPDSLKSQNTSASVRALRSSDNQLNSAGYQMVHDIVALKAGFSNVVAPLFIFVDEIISDMEPSSQTISGKEVTITQDLINRINAVSPDDPDNSDLVVGETEPIPPFVYNNLTGDPLYNYIFEMEDNEDGYFKFSIYWSNDKKKVKVTMMGDDFKVSFLFNEEKNTAKIAINTGTEKFRLSLKKNPLSAKKGIYVFFKGTSSNRDFEITGYADNDGGVVNSTFDEELVLNTVTSLYYFEEFNASGKITFGAYSTDNGANWTILVALEGQYEKYNDEINEYDQHITDLEGIDDVADILL